MTSAEKDKSRKNSKTIQQTNMCWESRQADRQAPIKFKSEFGKIGETGKYLGMWKLKNYACVFPLLRTFIYGVCGKSFTQLQRIKEDKETHDNSYSLLEIS